MADEVRGKSPSAIEEEKVLAFWREREIFEKSLAQSAPNGEFVFYDGPPFATGTPHQGHILGSTSKDVFGRYKTMRGFHARRRWGWDCHGLPVESIVEKKLGLKNKKEILTIGVKKFNETARAVVLEYIHEWKRYVERIGRWVSFDDSYKTMDNSYIESVWWALSEIHKKGQLYEGRKVLMYCTHCETPLAKAEIAMDNTYKDITEEAVTVKFKITNPEKAGCTGDVYMLAWTTTPWTLPGNVGLAVGKDIEYGVYIQNGVQVIVATARAESSGLSELVKKVKGSDLVGLTYEPLYEVAKAKAHTGKKWEVLEAGFVETESGTGIVHTAVIYGEDDYELGKKEGLPMVPLLTSNGVFNDDAPELVRGQFYKKAEPLIKEDLEKRGILFAKASNTHSYPHCYRCGAPLIYNAVSSWFIDIQKVKAKLLSENEKITWIPEHLKEGRFRHIVENAPDWTISRNRFWASPLPIWKDSAGNLTVIGSRAELQARTRTSGNTYMVVRHAEAENNVAGLANSRDTIPGNLTPFGVSQAIRIGATLKEKGITRIYASPLARTLQTAKAIQKELGLADDALVTDERIREIQFGVLDGKKIDEYHHSFTTVDEMMNKAPEGGESWADVRVRVGNFLYDIEKTRSGEHILIVTHGVPFRMLVAVSRGLTLSELQYDYAVARDPSNGEVRDLPFTVLPHNDNYELDYHLPYLDDVQLVNEKGEELTRVAEVVDCWVESGSMPFAEFNYPAKNQNEFLARTPADFISEYIAQTRTWFYYMHALSVILFGHLAFKNVVTTGTILASDGEKMSKSKNNFTDPMLVVDKYGSDALRYYLMSGVAMQGEDSNFKDDEVKEVHGRIINILRNVLAFYEIYKQDAPDASSISTHVLDAWMLARVRQLHSLTTSALEQYDTVRAVRPMRDFVDDLSTWYVRRSRDRAKQGGEDTKAMLATLRYVLYEFSKIIAPVMPFVAENIYMSVKSVSDKESVHLTSWSTLTVASGDAEVISEMEKARTLATEALKLRQDAGIIVRQPLASLSIIGELSPEITQVIAEEINVQKIIHNAPAIALDTTLTPELIALGDERAFSRALADARKQLGLAPRDQVTVTRGEGPYEAVLSKGKVNFNVVKNAS